MANTTFNSKRVENTINRYRRDLTSIDKQIETLKEVKQDAFKAMLDAQGAYERARANFLKVSEDADSQVESLTREQGKIEGVIKGLNEVISGKYAE